MARYKKKNDPDDGGLRSRLIIKMKVLFICQASPSVGLGHIARSCAVACELAKHSSNSVTLVTFGDYSSVQGYLSYLRMQNVSAERLGTESDIFFHLSGIDILVVDGIEFSPSIQNIIEGLSLPVVSISPLSNVNSIVSAIVCRAIPANLELKAGCEIYTGVEYAVFSPPPSIEESKLKIGLTMGGTDLNDVTSKAVTELNNSELGAVHFEVRLGPYYAGQIFKDLQSNDFKKNNSWTVTKSTGNLANQFSDCNLIICLPGISMYEFIAEGKKLLIVDLEKKGLIPDEILGNSRIEVVNEIGHLVSAIQLLLKTSMPTQADLELSKLIKRSGENLAQRLIKIVHDSRS